MVIKYDSSSFFESSGNAAAKFGEDLRDGIARHSCNIWSQFPGFVTGGRNPLSSYARGFMNGVCTADSTPPPVPDPEVEGGQCPNAPYDVEIEYTLGTGGNQRDRTVSVFGEVVRAAFQVNSTTGNFEVGVFAGTMTDPDANMFYQVDAYNGALGAPDFTTILSITRTDGMPDDCGNRPPQYPPEPPPSQNDLSTTITVNNFDGIDADFTLSWNRTNNNYNFPFNFKLNGTNVTVDVGGITIFGDPSVTSDNTGNDSPPPGSDGGEDVDGNPYVETFPDTEFPTEPELVQPNLKDALIEYLICESGIIEVVQDNVLLPPGYRQVWQLIFSVVGGLLQEICEDDVGEIGFPEIYPVLPGVDRPIIMYYYKEVIDGAKQPSTYVSTLPNPLGSAVSEIDTVEPPDRQLGKVVKSLLLLDGSRVVARGLDETAANVQFNFLLARVIPTIVPPDVNDKVVLTTNERLQEIDVVCTQIEYYPDGKSFGRSPSVRRIIPVE